LWVIDLTLGGGRSGFVTAVVAGLLCGVLRFVPYVGTWLGAALPLGLAFAAHPGYNVFLATVGMFVVIELVISQVIEPNLLGSSTGLSPIAVLASAVFWTWLWGPIGLLLSMPLTVVLVVMGKYVPHLAFLDVLLGDAPVLEPSTRVYQRLMAGNDEEAADLASEYLAEMPLEAVFDRVLLPALAQAELDAHRGKLDDGRLGSVRQGIRDIAESLADRSQQEDVADAAAQTVREAKGAAIAADGGQPTRERRTLKPGATIEVLCLPARSEGDAVAATMLGRLLERRGYRVAVVSSAPLTSEVAALASTSKADAIVISAMPPKAALNVHYILKRIGAQGTNPVMLVGLWTNTRDVAKLGLSDFEAVRIVKSLAAAEDRLDELSPADEVLTPG
jgi:methylmalonyl-CoA mutase cobalamin-binding subunit